MLFTDSAHLTPLYEPYGIITTAVAHYYCKNQAMTKEKVPEA